MLPSIAGWPLGPGAPLFVVAELGLNHGGSVERALALVDAAADAGASAIKLQTLVAAELVCATAPAPMHLADAGHRSLVDFFRQFELDEAEHRAVAARARERGLAVLSTPFCEAAVDLLERVGVDAYKIASGDLTHLPLIARAAHTGRPLVISTGMSDLAEVAQAVETARGAGATQLALLHCVSCYPVPAGSENLGAIRELARAFGVPVGLSDHGTDPLAAPLAVALGATIYERHLVLDKADGSIDAAVSSTPAELRACIASAERARRSLGDGRKVCLNVEAGNRLPSRRSLRAAGILEAGHRIVADDLIALRPGGGIDPGAAASLIGAVVTQPIDLHAAITSANVAPRTAPAANAA